MRHGRKVAAAHRRPTQRLFAFLFNLCALATVTRLLTGDDVLQKLEQLPTTTSGIFVMPKERITILSSYVLDAAESFDPEAAASAADAKGAAAAGSAGGRGPSCCVEVGDLKSRVVALAHDLQEARKACLP